MPHFECGAFDHSATSPAVDVARLVDDLSRRPVLARLIADQNATSRREAACLPAAPLRHKPRRSCSMARSTPLSLLVGSAYPPRSILKQTVLRGDRVTCAFAVSAPMRGAFARKGRSARNALNVFAKSA